MGKNSKWKKVVTGLSSALRGIARYMHTKFGVVWTYSDKVTLLTRKSRHADTITDKSIPYMSPSQATQKSY